MPFYTGTDLLSQLDATTPLGTSVPSELDDSIREIKTVLKAVLSNHLSDRGCLRSATWKYLTGSSSAVNSINLWNRLPLGTISDPTGLLSGGTYTTTIKPTAGLYIVKFFCTGLNCGVFQARVSEATGNGITAANPIADLVGGVSQSSTGSNVATQSIGVGYLVADGIKSYSLDMLASALGSFAVTPGTNGLAGAAAGVEFNFLGATNTP